MSRLLARAALVAAVAAFALTQLEGEQELLAWELLLLGTVIWEMRGLPGTLDVEDPALFDFSAREARRLPRAVSSVELSVIDAVTGHLGPERRLQPTLKRIAVHRLRRQGIPFDSTSAVELLGRDGWAWLENPTGESPPIDTVESIVARLERL